MRLLKFDERGELRLTKDLIDDIPTYAILSHTWGADDDEITFDELENGVDKSKAGYAKIQFCGEQARKDRLEYFWVDTCCINKANHAELAEDITSMFRWYSEAAKCYVFLCDVSSRKRTLAGTDLPWESALRTSRWFTRGWTLQELLAPGQVEFFSREGEYLGDKNSLKQKIHEISYIPIEALRGAPLPGFSIEERMRWASRRNTTREEDRAYCLTGIFGVSMLPNYGEGRNAFQRLKSKIAENIRRQVDKIEQPWASSAPDSMERRIPEPMPVVTNAILVQDRRRVLMASLSFDQMDSRRSTITNAYPTTCKWFLGHSAYLDWIDPHNLNNHRGFLWLSGKPGAGKSTLMKFAHAQADKGKIGSEILVSFFFNARGDELEQSTAGMYRALLFQLLNQAADLQEILDEIHPQAWTTDNLCKLFLAAVAKLGQRQLKCFVDALDECDEQQIREMVAFFEGLGTNAVHSGTRLYMCFASRHYPTIDIQYGRRLTLEDDQGHGEDMAKYVQSHLRAGEGKAVEEVKTQIQEKANGIFLWVVLVVDILNEEFRRGRIFAVKTRLQEIPQRLSDLFKDILQRDRDYMSDLLLCLQWISFAVRPLTREEFYFAMVAGLHTESRNIARWDPDEVTADDMTRFVLNSSKGLAELTKSKNPTVQFIHESVRDFLIKDNGFSELWPELGNNLYTLSHDQLKRCCETYLNVDLSDFINDDQSLPSASSQSMKDLRHSLTTTFPFLQYASRHLLRHAEEAESCTTTQADFLKSFRFSTWLNISNILQTREVRRYTPGAKLLYVLAENNCPNLIKTRISGARGERYHYPLFAALANGHQDAVRALLLHDSESPEEDIAAKLVYGRDFSVRKDQTPLLWALERGLESLAETLLTSEDVDHSTVTRAGRDALSLASEKGYGTIVTQLLRTDGIDVNTSDKDHRTSLSYAAQHGHEDILKLLIDKGANIETTDKYRCTALHWASRWGRKEVVRLLLDKGANIETTNKDGCTALHWASRWGHKEVVQLLVYKWANVKTTDKDRWTALHWASRWGQKEVVRLLVDNGANVEATDRDGCTALHWASLQG